MNAVDLSILVIFVVCAIVVVGVLVATAFSDEYADDVEQEEDHV